MSGLMVASGHQAFGGDWPQFRGPNRDGVSHETGLVTSWSEAGPKVLWRTSLGEGYSGISVSKGRIYTMFDKGEGEYVICLDASDGKEIWRHRADNKFENGQGNGPRSTPTVDGPVVYAASANGKLMALSAGTGESLWQHDLRKEYRAKIPRWGMSSSPLVEGDLLLAEVGGPQALIVAFDKKTGKEVWKSLDGKAGYSTPLAITVDGVRQILFFTGWALYSVSPKDGSAYWRLPWKTSWDVNAAMPIFIPPDKVFISSGYDTGAVLLQIEGTGDAVTAKELWRSRVMKNKFSSSVLHGGYLYGFDSSTLKCIDAASGEMKWRTRGFGFGSLIYADGHLIVLGERGQLAVVEATPKEYREKSRMRIFRGKTWTLPTLAGGKLYLRDEYELISLNVAG